MGTQFSNCWYNMSKSLLLTFPLLFLAVQCLPNYPKEAPATPGISYDPAPKAGPGMPYNYGWAVADPDQGLNYGQNENSDGNVVTGEYRVLLPDGRTQIVRYRADHESGYVADVTYEGEAIPYVAPAKPTYPAPAPAKV